ncbi:MAG: hypothetical protein LUG98_06945 [Tannerellaceae bacterium]|nr:hypothetical protein [Tannerellaceae bacterium]
MSFAGHALDMMKRTQENRARLKESCKSSKDALRKHGKQNPLANQPQVTAEEYEEVNRQLKKRDIREHRFYLWILIIFGLVALGLLFLLVTFTQ